tara:strand:- start:114 stop:302 length:189 start_codon:yes stop_codon:yes gene_type:complete
MNHNLKKIKLNALVKKQEYEEYRAKWKDIPEEDPMEKYLALRKYVQSKNEYLDLIEQIEKYD